MNERNDTESSGTFGEIVRGFLKLLTFVFGGYWARKRKD